MRRLEILALALFGLDVAALLVPAFKADLFLRPAALAAIVALVWTGPAPRGVWFLRIGLVVALIVETVQLMHLPIPFVAVATGLYYLLYTFYFAMRGFRFSISSLIPFAIVSAYVIGLFTWFEPYGYLRIGAIFYLPAAILMAGLGVQGFLRGPRWVAVGAAILLISDSLRAFTIFKVDFERSEALIVGLYLAGQLALAASSGALRIPGLSLDREESTGTAT